MLFKRLRQPVLLAGVLVGGATMFAGSAQATVWKSTCAFITQSECKGDNVLGWSTTNAPLPNVTAPGNPPKQLGDKKLIIINYNFANGIDTVGIPPISNPVPTGHFDFEWQDSDTPSDFGDDNWNVRTVFDNALSGLLPTSAGDAVGTLNYTLAIIGSTSTFKGVEIDSAHTGFGNTVTKTIISPPVSITSVDGNPVSALLSGTFVDVTDTYRVTNTGGLNSFSNGFTQASNLVPGPLPLFGLGAAFGFSRRLRNRIKGTGLA